MDNQNVKGISYCVDRTEDGGYYYMAAKNDSQTNFVIKIQATQISDNMKFKKPFTLATTG